MASVRTTAQIVVVSGFVAAVVDMLEPVTKAPEGMLFQDCDNHDKAGMYWNGKDYQKEPLTIQRGTNERPIRQGPSTHRRTSNPDK